MDEPKKGNGSVVAGTENIGFIEDGHIEKQKHAFDVVQTNDEKLDVKYGQISSSEQHTTLTEDEITFELLEVEETRFTKSILRMSNGVSDMWHKSGSIIIWCFALAVAVLYFVYFGFAMKYDFGTEPSIRLLWYTCVVVMIVLWYWIWKYHGESITKATAPFTNWMSQHGTIISWVVVAALYVGIILFIIMDAVMLTKQLNNLTSLAGIVVFVTLYLVTSKSPAHVNWRAVAWGVALQFVFALIILRWDIGFHVFKWIGNRVTIFLSNASAGSAFLFGAGYKEHYFAFSVLPTIIFFSTCIAVLYHLGIMQFVIQKVGWFLQTVLSTSAGESLNAAGNIFFGQSEVSFIIKPFVGYMTCSELHAVLTAGFATVSGSLMAGYIQFGAEAHHLIAASVMSAPAALAISKLRYPERHVSKTTAEHVKHLAPSPHKNVIEAMSNGACNAVTLVAYIAANIIAFFSILHFLNDTLTWFGDRVGLEDITHEPFTFEFICSYLLYPCPLLMGVQLQDCRKVAKLIGIKLFTSAFIGYKSLGDLMNNKQVFHEYTSTYANGTWTDYKGGILLAAIPGQYEETFLKDGFIAERSEVIATYAMCSLADVGVMGIMLGILGGMAPHRKRDLSKLVFSAMVAGNVACFMTACVAGLFYQEA